MTLTAFKKKKTKHSFSKMEKRSYWNENDRFGIKTNEKIKIVI